MTSTDRNILSTVFQSSVPEVDKATFTVQFEALDPKDLPIVITQNEFMRHMKDMAAMQPGMNFYGELPDSYTLVVNTSSELIERIRKEASTALSAQIEPLEKKVEEGNAKIDELRKNAPEGKLDEAAQKESDRLLEEVGQARTDQERIIKEYAATQPLVKQLIDIALLGNGLLHGKELSDFIKRSVSML